MRAFRLLNKNEIECRIAEVSKTGKGLSLLLYKTARTDAALLDEVYGPERWQNDFKMLDGKLYGGIGIKFGDEWIWRWDCGSESNMEAEKGQASDAFKRAGFKWGLGAELYTAPRIFVFSDKCTITDSNGKFKCFDTFSVKLIDYDAQGNITALEIVNDTNNTVCFTMGEKRTQAVTRPSKELRSASVDTAMEHDEAAFIPSCSDCGAVITVAEHDYSCKKYKKPLCRACQRKQA